MSRLLLTTIFVVPLTGVAVAEVNPPLQSATPDPATVVVQSGSPVEAPPGATRTIVVHPGQTISVQPGQVVVLVVQPTPADHPASSPDEANTPAGREAGRPRFSPSSPVPDRGSLRHFQDEQLFPSER
jgi:ABC-type Fe3+-hydroxamate transport system substrate-binding protein